MKASLCNALIFHLKDLALRKTMKTVYICRMIKLTFFQVHSADVPSNCASTFGHSSDCSDYKDPNAISSAEDEECIKIRAQYGNHVVFDCTIYVCMYFVVEYDCISSFHCVR